MSLPATLNGRPLGWRAPQALGRLHVGIPPVGIGFDGLLMTDDLSMNALSGSFRDRTAAAFRAGIKVDRLMFISFILAGAIAGLAGWLLAIRTSGATANLGTGMLFNAFAAVVIGGVSLKGGVGKLPGVYAGVLLLSSIHTAINLMGLPAHYTQVILGLLVLAAVLLGLIALSRMRLGLALQALQQRAGAVTTGECVVGDQQLGGVVLACLPHTRHAL